MDGTLVDTEPYWVQVEQELVEAHGGGSPTCSPCSWSATTCSTPGATSASTAAWTCRAGGRRRLLDGVVEPRRAGRSPGGPAPDELLGAPPGEANVPCALVTMSYERFVAPVLARLPKGSSTSS